MKKLILGSCFISMILLFGCGEEKSETFKDKIDAKVEKVESEAKKLDSKIQKKASELEDKVEKKVEKKSGAPLSIKFKEGENDVTVTISIQKPVKNLNIQVTPLDGLEIEKFTPVEKNEYTEPTELVFPVTLKTKIGRLGVYASGNFDGKQLATGQTYEFKEQNSKKAKPSDTPSNTVIKDGDGEVIRVTPAKEK